MKVLFVRHGESQDDLENKYGGWEDFPLTATGQDQLAETASRIQDVGESFEVVLCSPLKRARSSAEIISLQLKLPIEVLEYVKERNTYGILSGMEKQFASVKYPEQVEKLENGEYVDGSEREEDLVHRIKKSLEIIGDRPEERLIVVTHGVYLKFLGKIMNMELVKKEDGGMILTKLESGQLTLLRSGMGIEFQ